MKEGDFVGYLKCYWLNKMILFWLNDCYNSEMKKLVNRFCS